jgi:hypothetical protein
MKVLVLNRSLHASYQPLTPAQSSDNCHFEMGQWSKHMVWRGGGALGGRIPAHKCRRHESWKINILQPLIKSLIQTWPPIDSKSTREAKGDFIVKLSELLLLSSSKTSWQKKQEQLHREVHVKSNEGPHKVTRPNFFNIQCLSSAWKNRQMQGCREEGGGFKRIIIINVSVILLKSLKWIVNRAIFKNWKNLSMELELNIRELFLNFIKYDMPLWLY